MLAEARHTVVRALSTLLILTGLVVTIGSAGIYSYSRIEQAAFAREAAAITPADQAGVVSTESWVTPVANVTTGAAPLGAQREGISVSDDTQRDSVKQAQLAQRRDERAATSVSTATPLPTPVPILPAVRIVAPSIGLDSEIVESTIADGQWAVPPFVVGHLQGSGEPLSGGNVALVGHIDSLTSGDIFTRIGDLKPGDPIRLYTRATTVSYVVQRQEIVQNNDLSVVTPGHEEMVTLITCTGIWLPLQHDYDRRIIVIAVRAAS